MKDTNQVQEALESKAKKELKNCRRFYGALTYRSATSYVMKESRSKEAKVFCSVSPSNLYMNQEIYNIILVHTARTWERIRLTQPYQEMPL